MLKNPAGPTASSGLVVFLFGGRVVRMVVGTSASGVRLKKVPSSFRGELKSVT